MKQLSFNIPIRVILFLLLGLGACKKDASSPVNKPAGETRTIYQLIEADSASFRILRTILLKTTVSDTLSHFRDTVADTGSYTLFAPSDSCFISAGITVDSISHMGGAALSRMTKYFVSPGGWPSASFPDGAEMGVVQLGNSIDQRQLRRYAFLTHQSAGNTYFINGIPLLQYDIPAVNGFIHKIGGMIEHSSKDLATTVQTDPRFAANSGNWDPSWQSSNDTTQKTILFMDSAAMASNSPNAQWLPNFTALETLPGQVLFYPDFFPLNRNYIHSAGLGAFAVNYSTGRPEWYNSTAYSQPENLLFLLNPEPAVLGPGDGQPAPILRTPSVVTTNGILHLIDGPIWPPSFYNN